MTVSATITTSRMTTPAVSPAGEEDNLLVVSMLSIEGVGVTVGL